jgi:streptogramin lyase
MTTRLPPLRALAVLSLVLLVASLHGCGGCGNDPAAVPCDTGIDNDGDNYGEGCPAGPDCNDNDPSVHDDCCSVNPEYQGCPCDPAVDGVIPCFDGPTELADNPPCMKGTRQCEPSGVWSACGGQVLPRAEVCDGMDNDCDLEVDEGVQTACGNCLPGCDEVVIDDDPFPFPETDPSIEVDGVGLDENGDLVLDSTTYQDHFLWIANDAEGTVSKIDTRTGAEVGRYPSVTRDPARLVNHVGRPIPAWNEGGGGTGTGYADNRPSRTAIDFYGDMWVANRAHDVSNSQPSITKIMNDVDLCPDRNGNGTIDTSREVNGIPGIQLTDPLEFFGEADECIVMTVVVGAAGGTARALAIDAGQIIETGDNDPGNVWVGMWGEQAFYQIHGVTGQILQRVATPGVRPYGAAIDSVGRLYATDHCCGNANMARIDTNQNPAPFTLFTRPAFSGTGSGNYGIVIDLRDRVWVGGHPYGGLQRFDPATSTWTEARITGYFTNGNVRGVAIDTRGNIWAAFHPSGADGLVARINADTATSTGVWQLDGPQGAANIPVGVGVDFDGDVWTVNQSTSNASRLHIDATTGEPAPHPQTGNIVDVFRVGRQPYTYSDFTGLGLRVVTRPTGEYRMPIQGCTGTAQATWTEITWSATTPPATSVEIYVRVGDNLATLSAQPLYGPWITSPANLQAPPGPVPDGRYLLLIIRLISEDREATPIVHGVSVEWSCPGEPVP